MAGFPHLHLARKIDGLYKHKRVVIEKVLDPVTSNNLNNRQGHGARLLSTVDKLSQDWTQTIAQRKETNLPDLPNTDVVPVFLQIDTREFDVESLKSFGIEIIAEEEGGFIIGAALDNFTSLRDKIDKFINEQGLFKNKAAQLWQINDGNQWRVEQILSDDLKAKWDQIADDELFIVDVGIACYVRVSKQPTKDENESAQQFEARLARWKTKRDQIDIQRDEIAMDRQTKFEELVHAYGGELLSGFVDYDDSFSCRIKIPGIGLKDIVLNYQYLFEVIEYDPLCIPEASTGDLDAIEPELIAPVKGAPKICVIDSGIQENHKLLSLSIDTAASYSFVETEDGTADLAANGGHGTRVAGAILYPNGIPRNGQHQLHCFIQNAKVLGSDCKMPATLYPPSLMEQVVERFEGTRIFNMSINTDCACKTTHMSQWASAIDKLMFEKDVLFVLSAGNLKSETKNPLKPGVKDYLKDGKNYPQYLLENSNRIANPGQSCFALTVGSVCIDKFDNDLKESFGGKDDPSCFSRTGPGLWGMVKPDVVEYAGDLVKEKNANPNISYEGSISPELVKSTYHGGQGVGRDAVGTSFGAGKVTHILAHLERLYPKESVNLYRALIAQSARLPKDYFRNPSFTHLRHYGYGIPDVKRAVENSEKRLTLIGSNSLSAKQAHLYSLKIPQQLRRPGQEFDVLVEVTLSFMARPRRTRRRMRSYVSTWLDWESSKLGERYDEFANRVLQNMEEPEERAEDQNSIKWVIRERKDWSTIKEARRQDNSLQKSWCILKAYSLPEEFSLAIVGHKGWEADLSEEVPYSIAVSFEALGVNVPLYEMIRQENQIELPAIEQEVRIG